MEAVLIDPAKKGADKFYIGTVPVPRPVEGEVLIEVKAVALSAWEKGFAQDDDPRSLARRTRKRIVNLGLEFSGVVHSSGRRFKAGQRVMGGTHLTKDEKSLAQYVAAREEYLAELPDDLAFTQAAALPIGAETALTGFGKAMPGGGDRVLVVGASGGVGVYAVQIAAALGADVTAIGGKNSAPRLKELGATTVHSYRDTSFEDLSGTYDTVFDLSGRLRFGQVTKKLSRTGAFVNVNPQKDLAGVIASLFSRRKAPFVYVPHSSATAQTSILDMVARDAITPVVEAVYDIRQFRTAFTDLTQNERFGKIIISY
ncbi:NAD(P)-dependent alcohol dehydrogenase [Streptomyces sp. AS02]|uniref:NAD(P)-dependent alcohol dehydrogenase n=1 Tax=Streptomyces sp. AS02 TaxID=2938946 RepID=UPI0020201CD7|nr:NAD(P)-dependent alcohol dehydrogenase [Streptomyces sp. AS02]MCL8016180.1 NAD(P)-dependent alcohol dehydrogenase [Streptomyces sp. AS02]